MLYHPVDAKTRNQYPTDICYPEAFSGILDVKIPILYQKYIPEQADIFLTGWLAEAKNPRAVVLYCHGNAGNLRNCAHVLHQFRNSLNVTILAFDYRGYGASVKLPITEEGLQLDTQSARVWLAKHTGVRVEDIILCGYSLGGGVAVNVATQEAQPPRGLILDRTFTSIPELADEIVPIIPVGWLVKSQYDSLRNIKQFNGALLQIHGDADKVVPYKLGRKLFDAANEPKTFVTMPGCGHNDPLGDEAIAAIRQFIDKLNAEQAAKAASVQ